MLDELINPETRSESFGERMRIQQCRIARREREVVVHLQIHRECCLARHRCARFIRTTYVDHKQKKRT